MKKNIINNLIIITFSLIILLIFLILFVDVRFDELTNQNIGLYSLNKFFKVEEYNQTYDAYSDYFLYISLFFVVIIGIIGVGQIIKNKSISSLDKKILGFWIMLIVLCLIWVLFDKVFIINYRPIQLDLNNIESSFPSTHLMIVTFIYLSICSFIEFKGKSNMFKIATLISIVITILITTLFRILSGVHWFTDIIGGILIGILLFLIYIKLIIHIRLKECKY